MEGYSGFDASFDASSEASSDAGFEPEVGEIRALRTFRVGPGGVLYPLFSDSAWVDGVNTARCLRAASTPGPPHAAPDPDCTCGFYAYGTEAAVADHPHGRHVLGVVACWGRVIAGTRGLRAECSRIEALWLSDAVPEDLGRLVRDRHPAVTVHRDRSRMLAEHPVTELDCYEPAQAPASGNRLLVAGALAAAVLGVLPMGWLGGPHAAGLLWAVLGGLFLVIALCTGWRRPTDVGAHRRRLVSLSAAVWMLAPFAGTLGWALLRVPVLEIAVLGALHHHRLARDAGRFPADIG